MCSCSLQCPFWYNQKKFSFQTPVLQHISRKVKDKFEKKCPLKLAVPWGIVTFAPLSARGSPARVLDMTGMCVLGTTGSLSSPAPAQYLTLPWLQGSEKRRRPCPPSLFRAFRFLGKKSLKKLSEKFGGIGISSYLCIRFPKETGEHERRVL